MKLYRLASKPAFRLNVLLFLIASAAGSLCGLMFSDSRVVKARTPPRNAGQSRITIVPSLLRAGSGQSAGTSGGAARPSSAAGHVEYTTFASPSLGSPVKCAVSLPPSYETDSSRRYPVVIFLHGLFNSERDWEGRGAEAKLNDLRTAGKVGEFIVAIPYGANSFYLNGKDGTRYEDAIVKDFIPFVDKAYRTKGSPRYRVLEGISMGGYGALVIAFKHPELFTAVAAHSAAIFDELPKPPTSQTDMRGKYRYEIASKIFGAPPDNTFFQENNPLYLAKKNSAKVKGLSIYFDVGEQDRYGFDAGNKQLDEALSAAGIKHEFHLAPGPHGWPFLLSRSEEAFTFCWNALR